MTPKRLAIVVPCALLASGLSNAHAADPVPSDPAVAAVVAQVRDWVAKNTTPGNSLGMVLDNWKFHHGDIANGQSADLADADWETQPLTYEWGPENSVSWYRKVVEIPQTLGGVPVAGHKVYLDLSADDDGVVYVNGKEAQQFHWDQGHVLLSPQAKPGERYLVAVKVLNGPGSGHLMAAALTTPDLPAPSAAARDYLDSEDFTIWREGQDAAAAPELKAREQKAAAEIHPADLTAGDAGALTAEFHRAADALGDPAMRARTDDLVGYAHTDIDWLWEWPETKSVWFHDDSTMLKLMDEFPDLHFSQTQGVMYKAMQDEHPELFAGIQAAVKRGQWEPLNGWCENDMNMPSGESEIRQAILSNEYFQANFGVTSPVCWRPDSFGHAWTLPMILHGSGVDNYYFCRAGKGVPIFWWQSPDGSRILAFNEPAWYNVTISPATSQLTVTGTDRFKEPGWLTVYGVGDHGGGPTRNDINEAHHLDSLAALPHMKFGKASEFFEQLRKNEPKEGYPVIADEMNPTFKGCYTSHVDTKRYNRLLEHSLYATEAWSSVTSLLGRPYPSSVLRDSWYTTLLNQFHDIMAGSNIHPSYLFAKSQDESALSDLSREQSGALDALAQEINTAGHTGTPVVVFNSLGWARTEVVRADLALGGALTGVVMASDSRGAGVPATTSDAGNGLTHVEFVAQDVPAVGYRVYWLAPGPAATPQPVEPGVLENEYFRVTYDATQGRVTGIYDKVHQKDLIAPGGAADQMQILWEGGGNAWDLGPIQSTTPATMAKPPVVTRAPDGSESLTLTDSYDKSTLVHRLTLHPGIPRVDFDLDMDWQEQFEKGKGGAFLKTAFDTSMGDNAQSWWEIPFGAIRRNNGGDESVGLKWIDAEQVGRQVSSLPTVTVPLQNEFNGDAFSTAANLKKGSFDDQGMTYPVEIIPHAGPATVDAIPYVLPDANSSRNEIVAQGQTIRLPKNGGGDLYLLAAASNGSAHGSMQVRFQDGSTATVPLGISDWVVNDQGLTAAFSTPNRLTVTGPDAADKPNIWEVRAAIPQQKPIASVTLPSDPHIHIFAMTVGPRVVETAVFGVALLNDGRYGSDMNKGTMRMSVIRSAGDPDPIFDVGRHFLRYALYPHQGAWEDSDVARQGWSLNTPLEARVVQPHAGARPPSGSFLNVSGKGIIMTALKQAENGAGLVLRFYNATGSDSPAAVHFSMPRKVRRVTLADMKETPGKELRMRGSDVTVPVSHWSVATLRIEF